MEALIKRAYDLDEAWDDGSIHEFLISFESRGAEMGGSLERARDHFNRAMELSRGRKIAPLVSFAENVCIQTQNRKEFDTLLDQALAFAVLAAAVLAGKETGALFVHPFDNELVMAGQGTIGLELLAELPDVATVVVPIGGGGLIAGVAAAIKETRPNVRVIGVEAAAAPSMHFSLEKGKIMEAPLSVTLADGIAVKRVGKQTFPVIRDLVDEVVLVEEEEIAQAIVALLERTKLLVEGAGAVTLAALLNERIGRPLGKTVCILSGGNIDVKTIAMVVERGLLPAGRYLKLKVLLEDAPGSLARLAADIAATRSNIYLISHDRRSIAVPLGKTEVLLELETRGYEHIREVIEYLNGQGYEVEVLK